MTNKKNNDEKKQEASYKDPFAPGYESENRTEPIDGDPFVNGDESDHSKVNERDSSLEKHKEHEDKDDQQSHAMTLDEQIEMYENYDYNIGDSGQYLGGRN